MDRKRYFGFGILLRHRFAIGLFFVCALTGALLYYKRDPLTDLFLPNRVVGWEIAKHEEGVQDDEKIRLSDVNGPKVLVVWTLDSVECFKSLFVLNKLASNFQEKGIKLVPVLVSSQRSRPHIFWGITVLYFSRYIRPGATWKTLFPFLTPYYDFAGQAYEYFDMKEQPIFLFVNRENKVIKKITGSQDWSSENGLQTLEELQNKLLGEKS